MKNLCHRRGLATRLFQLAEKTGLRTFPVPRRGFQRHGKSRKNFTSSLCHAVTAGYVHKMAVDSDNLVSDVQGFALILHTAASLDGACVTGMRWRSSHSLASRATS